jgi:hypothetical protein
MYKTRIREYFGNVICTEDLPLEPVLDGAGMTSLCFAIMLLIQGRE